MNDQASGFLTSFFVHILLVATAIVVNNGLPNAGKPLSLDFRLESISGRVVEKPKPRQKKIVKVIPKPAPVIPKEPEPVKKSEPVVEPEPVVGPTIVKPIEEPTPVVEEQVEEITEVELGEKEVEVVNEISEEEYQEQMRALFLKTHFQYIRDNIQHSVVYPRIARKRGWQGKVVIKFVVWEDGHVSDVEIVESSGYSVLDKNAVKSVKTAAPFPKPPIRTELIIPIRFGLV